MITAILMIVIFFLGVFFGVTLSALMVVAGTVNKDKEYEDRQPEEKQ
jgi:hypothetical protein